MHPSLVCCCLLRLVWLTHAYDVVVKVDQGLIVGERETTVFGRIDYYAFYGVPYAKPPVGKRRFRVPAAHRNVWPMALDGRSPNFVACVQPHVTQAEKIFGVEDCLQLNIYTPRNPKNGPHQPDLAVIVFYHGFGFFASFSHIYGPDFLIEHNVIVITATYRVGVFGFLYGNSTHKNMGLKDIVMSLEWIKRNVKQFGGDVNKVTVMGSGSASTLLGLLLTTKKRNLFTKMILHSGSVFSPSILHGDPKSETERFIQELANIGQTKLLKAKVEDVIKAVSKVYSKNQMSSMQQPIIPFTPVLEDKANKKSLLKRMPDDFYSNGLHKGIKMPILVGFNTRESMTEAAPFLAKPQLLKEFENSSKFHVPFSGGCSIDTNSKANKVIFDRIKSHYFDTNLTIDNFLQYTTDLQKYPIYKFIKAQIQSKSKTYVYKFNYQGKFNAVKLNAMGTFHGRVKGAAHGDELCYIFRCQPLYDTYMALRNDSLNKDRIFINEMAEMWSNFAKSGNPNLKSDPHSQNWTPMTEQDDAVMFIDRPKKLMTSKVEEKMFKFWNDLYERFYSKKNCHKVKDEL